MRTFPAPRGRHPWRLPVIAAALLAGLLAACGGDDASPETTGSPAATSSPEATQDLAQIQPIPLNSDLAVGDDRFVIGLQTASGDLVLGGDLTMRFYTVEGETGTLAGEVPAEYLSFYEGKASDGEASLEVGAYVGRFLFESAGDWGVDVSGTVEGQAIGPIRSRFTVVEDPQSPAIGELAPKTEQITLSDVDDITDIDSSDPPNPEFHELTVAEALELGKPLVIAFTTPAFCTSRICGPVMDEVVLPTRDEYGDSIIVVHIEPYDLGPAREEGDLIPVPAMDEWGLSREPWLFVIDAQGRVAAKFEGISSADEVSAALDKLLS